MKPNEEEKKQEASVERFDVLISIDIQKHNKAIRERFFQTDVQYFSLDIGSVVGIEQLLLSVLNDLGDAGIKAAALEGFSDKMAALGVRLENTSQPG